MPDIKIKPIIKHDGDLRQIDVWLPESKPSWKRNGIGTASLRISSHMGNKYLAFMATETAHNDNGNTSSKETHVTLDADDARTVYDFLKTIFE